MKHIQKSKSYRKMLADGRKRKKAFKDLPCSDKEKMAKELGVNLGNKKEKGNLGRSWNKHRNDDAMIEEARKMVKADKAKADEAALAAAAAEAAAATPAPAPPASNDNGDLKDAVKAALALGGDASKAAAYASKAAAEASQAAATASQAATKASKSADTTSQVVRGLTGMVKEHDEKIDKQGKQIGKQGEQIVDHENRLATVEKELKTLARDRNGQRPQEQKQHDQDSQLIAVGAAGGGNGWSSPSRAPSNAPAAAAAAANTATPPAGVAKKMPQPPSPSLSPTTGSFGHSNNDAAPSTPTDVVGPTPAPAFGTSFSQYRGVAKKMSPAPAAGGGGGGGDSGSSPLSSQDKKPPAQPSPNNVAPKKLFGNVVNDGGGRLSSGSLPTALVGSDSASTGAVGSGDAVAMAAENEGGFLLYKNPSNSDPPTLKVVHNVDGNLSWLQRTSSASFRIVVFPSKSTAGLIIHDQDMRLVLNHPIDRSIKLEPYKGKDNCLVWSARDHSQNNSGIVTIIQLLFTDPCYAAAFQMKFKLAQGMTPGDDDSAKSGIPSIFVVNANIDVSSISVRFDDARAFPESKRVALAKLEGVEGLPDELFQTLFSYTDEGYLINAKIREVGLAGLSPGESILVQSISLSLKALPVFSPLGNYSVFRTVDFENEEDVLKFRDSAKNDEPYVERAFLSTTLLPIEMLSVAIPMFQNMNTYFAILSKSGRYLLPKHCANCGVEWEVLFDLGTSFRILSFEDTMPGRKHGTGPDQTGRYRIVMAEI